METTFKEVQAKAISFANHNPQASIAMAYRQGFIDGYRDKNHYDIETNAILVTDEPVNLLEPTFEEFWVAYKFKKARVQAHEMWKRLTPKQKEQVMQKVDAYVASTKSDYNDTSDPRGNRMYPATFLNPKNMRWEDEVIITKKQPQYAEPELTFAQQSASVIGKLADRIRK